MKPFECVVVNSIPYNVANDLLSPSSIEHLTEIIIFSLAVVFHF